MNQNIVLNPGDTLTVTVAVAAPVVAPEVIADVKVENTDGTNETFVAPAETV